MGSRWLTSFFLLAFTAFLLVASGETVKRPDYPGITCKVTICGKGEEPVPCQSNNTHDKCRICDTGKYQPLDKNPSNLDFMCASVECEPDTQVAVQHGFAGPGNPPVCECKKDYYPKSQSPLYCVFKECGNNEQVDDSGHCICKEGLERKADGSCGWLPPMPPVHVQTSRTTVGTVIPKITTNKMSTDTAEPHSSKPPTPNSDRNGLSVGGNVGIAIAIILVVLGITLFILWKKGILQKFSSWLISHFTGWACKKNADVEMGTPDETQSLNDRRMPPDEGGGSETPMQNGGVCRGGGPREENVNTEERHPLTDVTVSPNEGEGGENGMTNQRPMQNGVAGQRDGDLNSRGAHLETEPVPSTNIDLTVIDSKYTVDKDAIDIVAEHIGKDWRRLGSELSFSDGQLENIKQDYLAQGHYEISYQMLRKWKDENYPIQLQKLAQLTAKIGRRDISSRLAEIHEDEST